MDLTETMPGDLADFYADGEVGGSGDLVAIILAARPAPVPKPKPVAWLATSGDAPMDPSMNIDGTRDMTPPPGPDLRLVR